LLVVGGYYVSALVVGAFSGNDQTVYYAVLLPLLVGVVAYLDSRRSFSPLVLWGLVLWGALHMAGGLVPASDDRVLYNVWLLPFVRFDQLVHAVGFGFAGLAFRETLRDAWSAEASGAALVFMGGLGIGGLNEMIEFLISQVVADTNIGGFENTGWDLVANAVGASVAALWVRHRHRLGRTVGSRTHA
jgi:uncharacterized membrane protein YjdF